VAANKSKASRPGREFALHATDDVHHVAVTFDHAVGIDMHAARMRDAAEIIARQVHEHHVFGVLFHVREQILFHAASPRRGRRREAACPR
jgi:hypothetical protein